MKNVSRNKFLLCFRPVVDMELVLETDGCVDCSRKNRSLKYIAGENEHSASENDQCSEISKNSMVIRHSSQRTFSKPKRVDDRKKLSQESLKSSSSWSFSRQKSMDSGDDKSVKRSNSDSALTLQENKTNQVLFSQSSVGPSPPPSSSSSSSCSTSISLSESNRQKQNKNNKSLVKPPSKKDYAGSSSSLNHAIILLLLSLSFTILWGRLCAILFTSIWLCFAPGQGGSRRDDEEEVRKLSQRDESRDYKKRIIMEGLLERNPQREGALNF